MTFCHFASDILNMLSLTFVSGLVCLLQNKSRDAGGNTKAPEQAQGGEKEINKIGQNERQVSWLRAGRAGGEVTGNGTYGVAGGRLGKKLKHVFRRKESRDTGKSLGNWGEKWLRGSD